MPRPLPPLPQIRSLVAVVAHGRLNRAAAALHLTESAVSHHIRRLESALGARLLERGHERATLTAAGERFLPRAREALRLLEEAIDELAGETGGKVVLTVPRTLATHWLVPRYPRLYEVQGELELHLLPTMRNCDLEREQIDLGVRLGSGPWPGLVARPLLLERTCPVAAPELAREWQEKGWEYMVREARLVANGAHPREWSTWCRATGRALPVETRFTTLDSFDLVLQAGLAGSGLIMGRTPMIRDALSRGELVMPFPEWAVSRERYHVVWPRRRPPNRHARVVIEWLAACAADTPEALWEAEAAS